MVPNDSTVHSVIEKLSAAGFEHRGNLGISGREAFRQPENFGPRANIYAGVSGIVAFRNHLAVLDALRSSDDLRSAYGKIKADIAAAVGQDVAEYTRRKSAFLCNLLEESKRFSASEILAVQVANRHDALVRPISPGDEVGGANVHVHSWRETYRGLIEEAYLDSLPTTFSARVERWRKIVS